MEKEILRAAATKDTFTYLDNVDVGEFLSESSKVVFKEIGEYYQRDADAKSLNWDLVTDSITANHPNHAEIFVDLLAEVRKDSEEVSRDNVVYWVNLLKKQRLCFDISAAAASLQEDELDDLLVEWQNFNNNNKEDSHDERTLFKDASIDDLAANVASGPPIGIINKRITEHLSGGLVKQDHVVVYGRPDAAKTTFVLNMAYGFTLQGLSVLYWNNEDAVRRVFDRYFTMVVGKTTQELQQDTEARELLEQRGYPLMSFKFSEAGNLRAIEAELSKGDYDVLIVDQIRNLSSRQENRVLQLEESARGIRTLIKSHDLVGVSVTQAGDSAENKLVLDMGDVDFNNTGVQGAADLMIGIGVNNEYKSMGRRMLSFPKDKLGQHEPLQVQVNLQRAKFI
jgi:archaellum biogenesis ATPase FlaH